MYYDAVYLIRRCSITFDNYPDEYDHTAIILHCTVEVSNIEHVSAKLHAVSKTQKTMRKVRKTYYDDFEQSYRYIEFVNKPEKKIWEPEYIIQHCEGYTNDMNIVVTNYRTYQKHKRL